MFEQLDAMLKGSHSAEVPTIEDISLRLAIGVLVGVLIGASYYFAQRKSLAAVWPLITTLVLLTILVAMTTMVIGDSGARAFGLVGALSIIRFRTVVEDTRDTAFVIYAVIVGMAVGAGNFGICLIGLPITSTVAVVLYFVGRNFAPKPQHVLEIRLGAGGDPETALQPVLMQHLATRQLLSATTARQGAALEMKYHIQLKDPQKPLNLLRDLNKVEGVQQVDLREARDS